MKFPILFTVVALTISLSQTAHSNNEPPKIEALTIMDENYLKRHRSYVDELGRSEFGTPIRKNVSDLQLLKRILEGELITQLEKSKFHSLGVALGDIYVKELRLEWRNYTDEYGKSHAVCVPKSSQCLFPVTMISKRGVLGVIPDVIKIYYRGVELIQDELPKLPYAVEKKPKTQKSLKTYRLN